jgi:hypothetical protein
MVAKQKFPKWVIVLIIVVLCGLCVVVLAVGGTAYSFFKLRSSTQEPIFDFVESFEPVPSDQFEPPILPIPTSSFNPGASGLTGDQVLEDYYLYDDFSSEALGWPVANDEKTILNYENGQYGFQVLQADKFDWAYAPVDFLPTDIWFDVQGLPGKQNGTFGVFCQDQDINNYYFVEFDLETRSYLAGVVINEEFTYLTPENDEGNHWKDSFAIHSKPEQVNRIGLTCTLDYISLFINDEWVDDFDVPVPFENSGEMALFVYAFDFADANGYKVFYDNVEIYSSQQ